MPCKRGNLSERKVIINTLLRRDHLSERNINEVGQA